MNSPRRRRGRRALPRAVLKAASLIAAAAVVAPGGAAAVGLAASAASDCDAVVFDQTDAQLGQRTMVVEDAERRRMLVLTDSKDRSRPCELRWWLDHNPQGVVRCRAPRAAHADSPGKDAAAELQVANVCDPSQCDPDPSAVELGYVRSMLATVLFGPRAAPHGMSALCIELECRTRVVRTHVATGSLLEQSVDTAPWELRPRKRVLVIGLGSSTMALWLRHALPTAELHAVDLSPGVVAAAACFGLGAGGSNGTTAPHLHVGDGRAFLASQQDGGFDAVVVDAFDSNASLPSCFRTRDFFDLARRKLAPGGALSLNLLSMGKASMQVLRSMELSFGTRSVWIGDAPGAEGIQSVIAAFAPAAAPVATPSGSAPPSRRLRRSGKAPAAEPGPAEAQGQEWLRRARFRQLSAMSLQGVHKVEELRDEALCPSGR